MNGLVPLWNRDRASFLLIPQDTVRRRPSVNKEVGPHQKLTVLAPQGQTSQPPGL